MNFISILTHFFQKMLNILEFSTGCKLLQNKNPRDPWNSTGPVPLPDPEKMNKLLHYNPDIRPGAEKWHEPVSQPFSG